MTKEEAIRILENALYGGGNFFTMSSFKEAIELALSTLKQVSVPKNKETGTQEPSLPANVDEAAKESWQNYEYRDIDGRLYHSCYEDGFKAGAEWMAGQGVTKEAVIGMATEEISINVSQQTLNELDLCPGDKVVVQIRKK